MRMLTSGPDSDESDALTPRLAAHSSHRFHAVALPSANSV